jgi:hypothetical protein
MERVCGNCNKPVPAEATAADLERFMSAHPSDEHNKHDDEDDEHVRRSTKKGGKTEWRAHGADAKDAKDGNKKSPSNTLDATPVEKEKSWSSSSSEYEARPVARSEFEERRLSLRREDIEAHKGEFYVEGDEISDDSEVCEECNKPILADNENSADDRVCGECNKPVLKNVVPRITTVEATAEEVKKFIDKPKEKKHAKAADDQDGAHNQMYANSTTKGGKGVHRECVADAKDDRQKNAGSHE